jgi:hypothetical protein
VKVPEPLRAEFETSGEAVVAQILARPPTNEYGWAAREQERQLAQLWLNEKHNEKDRRRRNRDRRDRWTFDLVFATLIISVAGVLISLYRIVHTPDTRPVREPGPPAPSVK